MNRRREDTEAIYKSLKEFVFDLSIVAATDNYVLALMWERSLQVSGIMQNARREFAAEIPAAHKRQQEQREACMAGKIPISSPPKQKKPAKKKRKSA
jgi:hypothetical protein